MASHPESEKPDFTGQIGQVALALPNFPDRQKGSPDSPKAPEWRFGSNGSLAINLTDDTWYDHQDQSGGGVFDLVVAFVGRDKAWQWLVDKGFQKDRSKTNGAANPYADRVPKWMDPKPVAIFEYHDDRGRLAYEVLKFPKEAQARYQQRRKHRDGSWIWGLRDRDYGKTKDGDWRPVREGKQYSAIEHIDAAQRWLYRRDEVLKAKADGRPVYLCEGEKDVETLRGWGQTATTNAGGAKYWSDSFDVDLAGADVVILPDNDDAGRTRATLRGASLRGKAKSVRVLDLSLHWNAGEKDDVTDWKEKAGGTAEQFMAMASRAPLWKPERPKSRYGGFTWDQVGKGSIGKRYDYLVDDWLPERGRSVVGGPSQSGKTFLATFMAMCVARGQPFFGNHVERGGVIYQAGEGGYGIENRFSAYNKHFDVPEDEDVPLVVLPEKVDLFAKDGDTQGLIDEIKAWSLTMSYPLRLVVIDTLATATIGADENSGKDMGFVLANIAKIEEACRCHVMLVHHMNADGKKLRGHTSVHANVDTVITVMNDESTKIRTVKLAKQKDGEDGKTLRFKLKSVAVGYNERRQKDITSCVTVPVNEAEAQEKESEKFGFTVKPSEELLLIPMFKAIEKYGKYVATEADGPSEAIGRHAVDFTYYLDVAVEMDASADDKSTAREKIRKSFERNMRFLIKNKVIGFKRTGDRTAVVWWTGRPIRAFPHTFPENTRERTNSGQTPDISRTNPAAPLSPGMADLLENGESLL